MLTVYGDSTMATKRTPLGAGPYDDLFGNFDHLFEGLLGQTDRPRLVEDDAGLIASFDLPGVRRADLKVKAQGQRLTIDCLQRGVERHLAYDIVRKYWAEGATATLADGVLDVRFPLASPEKIEGVVIEVR